MTSLSQIAGNRCNASKSTGPRTEESNSAPAAMRCATVLTAETVICAVEQAEEQAV
jgi:hypothetical protein